ncbi:MFS transporter [Natrinema sp. SYSU A 869]|uniref:MFS transporter n=1 Tax=Natrinema sp. SYSU A 869 TaxID=2871694 RepID=UPI001CA3A434|nr:MFS transporter [Natrinema sp. SYSU A 869]
MGEILASGLFVFAVTYLLLIPGRGLWAVLVDRSESAFFASSLATCTIFGGAFSALTGARVTRFVGGGFLVYALWLVYREVTAGPFDSPAHIIVGIVYLIGFGIGAGLVEGAERAGLVRRIPVFE